MSENSHDTSHVNHVDNPASLVGVFAVLVVLSLVNIGLAFTGSPPNLILQLGIAAVQAVIVGHSFMHLRFGDTITYLTVGSAGFWMFILFVLVLVDYLTRHLGAL